VKDRSSKALDFAHDTLKQILGLSTALVGGSVVFLADFASTLPNSTKVWLFEAWVVLGFSILFGVMAIMTMTSQLTRDKNGRASRGGPVVGEGVPARAIPTHEKVLLRARLQVLLFLTGIVLLAIFAWYAVVDF